MQSQSVSRFLLTATTVICLLTAGGASAELHATGGMAPDFTLKTLDGATVSLSDLRGKPVFIEFWATWCGFCRKQMPAMRSIHSRYGDRVHVLMVNTAESREKILEFATRNPLPGTVLLDPGDVVGEKYGTRILPSFFVVGADGTIRAAHSGALEDPEAFVRSHVD